VPKLRELLLGRQSHGLNSFSSDMVALSMARTSGYNKYGQNKRRCGQKEKREKIERGKKRERPKTSSEAEKAKLGLEQFPSLVVLCGPQLSAGKLR